MYELDDALDTEFDAEHIIDECVDIANFCLFIADKINAEKTLEEEYQLYLKLKNKYDQGTFDKLIYPNKNMHKEQDQIIDELFGAPK